MDMGRKFEAGTRVIAVDAQDAGWLERGETYVVKSVEDSVFPGHYAHQLADPDTGRLVPGRWWGERFVAAPEAPGEDAPVPTEPASAGRPHDEHIYVSSLDRDTVDTDLDSFEDGEEVAVYVLSHVGRVQRKAVVE